MSHTAAGATEIVGIFLTLAGLATMVAAAAMVSTVLAVLSAGAVLALLGVLAIYLAAALDRPAAPPPSPPVEPGY